MPSGFGMSTLALALALTPCGALLPSSFAEALRHNIAEHAAERADSSALGFAHAVPAATPPVVDTKAYEVDRTLLGMGSSCPFDSDRLVHATSAPLFSAKECRAIQEEAAAQIAAGAKSTFTMTDTNRDVAVHELPSTLEWLNRVGLVRVASLARACFPSAVDDKGLWVYRGLVINYDAAAGLTHQPMHRDASLISCTVPLSRRTEYEGGGTWIEPLGQALAIDQGHALMHPSAVRHAGSRIHAGERCVTNPPMPLRPVTP